MTIQTIEAKPYTVNIMHRESGVPEIRTLTFAALRRAVLVAREELTWDTTIHVSVTDERSGNDILDSAGDFYC